jgi:hypothetical protein
MTHITKHLYMRYIILHVRKGSWATTLPQTPERIASLEHFVIAQTIANNVFHSSAVLVFVTQVLASTTKYLYRRITTFRMIVRAAR